MAARESPAQIIRHWLRPPLTSLIDLSGRVHRRVSVHSLALQPAPISAAPELINRAARSSAAAADCLSRRSKRLHPVSTGPITLLGSRAVADSTQRAPEPELALAAARPIGAAVVVARYTDRIEHDTCALCWTGPAPMAGSVRRCDGVFTAGDVHARNICSRCLVTLEMLAVQFDTELQVRVETPA